MKPEVKLPLMVPVVIRVVFAGGPRHHAARCVLSDIAPRLIPARPASGARDQGKPEVTPESGAGRHLEDKRPVERLLETRQREEVGVAELQVAMFAGDPPVRLIDHLVGQQGGRHGPGSW